ncbi:MAG: hypothetical protein OXM02_11145, partial [Bacteroidota bacterium]|nr:hypothetical protein [Bacteroidota bacterium]
MPGRNAFRLIKIIEEMASANLIHRFELKLEAHNAKLEAQNATLEAQNSKFNLLLWWVFPNYCGWHGYLTHSG